MAETDPKSVQDLTAVVPTEVLQRFPPVWAVLDPRAVDDMSCRIDDLERNIADLMMQAGVEELEGENKTPASNKG
ncbi:HSBP1 protein, partial [Chloropsis hardwickii]|nr:HSBP1 protein [Chloropsis hardwickii]